MIKYNSNFLFSEVRTIENKYHHENANISFTYNKTFNGPRPKDHFLLKSVPSSDNSRAFKSNPNDHEPQLKFFHKNIDKNQHHSNNLK